jgi:hypothetical protein
MTSRGAYKILNRNRVFDPFVDPLPTSDYRMQRILESLRTEILEGGGGDNLRIRMVIQSPREIFRLELELPELGYQRTTLLDRDALEELLSADDVRRVVGGASLTG